jgi:hypothetical protein
LLFKLPFPQEHDTVRVVIEDVLRDGNPEVLLYRKVYALNQHGTRRTKRGHGNESVGIITGGVSAVGGKKFLPRLAALGRR